MKTKTCHSVIIKISKEGIPLRDETHYLRGDRTSVDLIVDILKNHTHDKLTKTDPRHNYTVSIPPDGIKKLSEEEFQKRTNDYV